MTRELASSAELMQLIDNIKCITEEDQDNSQAQTLPDMAQSIAVNVIEVLEEFKKRANHVVAWLHSRGEKDSRQASTARAESYLCDGLIGIVHEAKEEILSASRILDNVANLVYAHRVMRRMDT